MSKPTLKEILMIVAPVLALGVFAFFLSRQQPRLQLEKVRIDPVSATNRQNYPPEIDTRVTVTVKYNPPLIKTAWDSEPQWADVYPDAGYLLDEHGRKYTYFKSRAGAWMSIAVNPYKNEGSQRYSFGYGIPLASVPKSAGRVMFISSVTVDNWTLPLSVVVRDR